MTALTNKFATRYLVLLFLVTAMAAELIRFSGPLLDSVIERDGVIIAALTALATYLAPGILAYALSFKRRVSGPMILIAVSALTIARVATQFLEGMVRFGFGLATVALSIATLGLVAAAASQQGPRIVGGGIGFGLLFSALLNLAFGTWDPLWRSGPFPIIFAFLLSAAAIAAAIRIKDSSPGSHARGLWALGPVLSMGVVIFANPAFISSQVHVPLWLSAFVLLAIALALPTILARAHAHRLIHAVIVVLGITTIFFAPPWPAPPSLIISIAIMIFTSLVGLAAVGLLTVIVSRPSDRATTGPLSLAISGAGALTILPILLFQLDYDIPLGFPNAFIWIASALILASAAIVVGRRGDQTQGSATPELKPVLLPMLATLGALGVVGILNTSGVYSPASSAPVAANTAKIFNWNLHYGVSANPSVDLAGMVKIIKQEEATVVTLQEVSRGWIMGGGADMATYLANELGMDFAFVGAADHQFGNALLWDPATPITDIERFELTYGDGPQWRSAIGGDVNLTGGQFRVITAHLQHREENTPTRIAQLDDLFAEMPAAGRTLITGDFNAQPGWKEIDYLTDHGFISGQDTAGDISELTWPSHAPNVRIDWFFGKGVTFHDFKVLPSVTSDHRPLVATVQLN